MLKVIEDFSEVKKIHSLEEEGILLRDFICEKKSLEEAANFFENSEDKREVHGEVGAATEDYRGIYVCRDKSKLFFLRHYEARISELFPIRELDLSVCASIIEFDRMQGMSSHKDYSYNRAVLGTIVLQGEVLYGSASTREGAHVPENLTLLKEGDLALIKAKPFSNEKFDRPYFYVSSPVKSLISRSWIRNAGICHAEKEE